MSSEEMQESGTENEALSPRVGSSISLAITLVVMTVSVNVMLSAWSFNLPSYDEVIALKFLGQGKALADSTQIFVNKLVLAFIAFYGLGMLLRNTRNLLEPYLPASDVLKMSSSYLVWGICIYTGVLLTAIGVFASSSLFDIIIGVVLLVIAFRASKKMGDPRKAIFSSAGELEKTDIYDCDLILLFSSLSSDRANKQASCIVAVLYVLAALLNLGIGLLVIEESDGISKAKLLALDLSMYQFISLVSVCLFFANISIAGLCAIASIKNAFKLEDYVYHLYREWRCFMAYTVVSALALASFATSWGAFESEDGALWLKLLAYVVSIYLGFLLFRYMVKVFVDYRIPALSFSFVPFIEDEEQQYIEEDN